MFTRAPPCASGPRRRPSTTRSRGRARGAGRRPRPVSRRGRRPRRRRRGRSRRGRARRRPCRSRRSRWAPSRQCNSFGPQQFRRMRRRLLSGRGAAANSVLLSVEGGGAGLARRRQYCAKVVGKLRKPVLSPSDGSRGSWSAQGGRAPKRKQPEPDANKLLYH